MRQLSLLFVVCALARAQCETEWLPVPGSYPGVNGCVGAIAVWDPDGTGPLSEHYVIGGQFDTAGDVLASNVALLDPTTGQWSALGSGVDGIVRDLLVDASGGLIVAGTFLAAGGVPGADGIARWNGTSWSGFGAGTIGSIESLAELSNGDLVIGGTFANVGSIAASNIARWDGANWWPLGSGTNAAVNAVAVVPNGDVFAFGEFTAAGSVLASRAARWDGANWTALGVGLSDIAQAATVMPNGDVIAGGRFTNAGGVGVGRIARWDGATWSALGSLPGAFSASRVFALASFPNGDVIASGVLPGTDNIARWNGASWSALGSGLTGNGPPLYAPPTVFALAPLPGGGVLAGGEFQSAGGVSVSGLATWDGASWSAFGTGTAPQESGSVRALFRAANGDVFAAGLFTVLGGTSARSVARWNGTAWTPLGAGLLSANELEVAANGDVLAAGQNPPPGAGSQVDIYRWDGTAWSAIGAGLTSSFGGTGFAEALVVTPSGDLIVGGNFVSASGVPASNIVRWDGTIWSPLGAGLDDRVSALERLSNGDLLASGWFRTVGGASAFGVAVWDGSNWAPLGPGPLAGVTDFGVGDVMELPNGDVVAAMFYRTTSNSPTMGRVSRWDGTSWTPLGPDMNSGAGALARLPGGDICVGGFFTSIGPTPANHIARWDGTSWSAIGDGTPDPVLTLQALPSGELWVGGFFESAGPLITHHLARVVSPCPATAIASGAGCTGSGGSNELSATALPWLGDTFRSEATGMPSNGLAIAVLGLTPTTIPLATILPQGGAGCSLLTSADLLELLVPNAGLATTQAEIPGNTALVGQVLQQQVVAIELDASANITMLTSTNALTLTIGAF